MKAQPLISRICITATLFAILVQPGFAGQTRPNDVRTTQDPGRINPSDHHLDIVRLTVPTQVQLGKPIDVAVTAADKDGVWYVELRRGDDTRRFFAGGDKVANFTATFDRASFGEDLIQATAFDHNHRPGVTVNQPVIVVALPQGHPGWEAPFAEADPAYALQVSGGVTRDQLKPPAGTPWWKWWAANYAKPYDWQNACPGTIDVTINGEVLHCWLNNHPQVRAHIVWEELAFTGQDDLGTEMGVGVPVPYDQWSWWQQNQLDQAFYYAYEYLKNGATNFGGTPLPPVPTNIIQLADNDPPYTLFSINDAWRLYVGTVAHSLALEIGGFVPSTVVNYKPDDLELLFNGHYLANVQYVRFAGPSTPERSFTGYGPYESEGIAAPPVTAFQFMLDQDILRPSHAGVIGQMLEYTRADMIHLADAHSPLDAMPTLMFEAVWGYRGNPPVASMMQKKVMHDPIANKDLYYGAPWAVSRGCWGASDFFQAVLRAANIPVNVVPEEPRFGGGGHGTAEFHTANLALADGDDAYNGLRMVNSVPLYPAGTILITQQTREAWFMDPTLPMTHHGLHAADDMGIKDLATLFIQDYCADTKANLSHADGSLYQWFAPPDGAPPYYTVQQLEAMNLWTDLAAKAAQLNYCK